MECLMIEVSILVFVCLFLLLFLFLEVEDRVDSFKLIITLVFCLILLVEDKYNYFLISFFTDYPYLSEE